MSAILSVRELEKTFGSVVAARAISLDVPAEQTVGIIGANGAGKTTFINMITGHIRPSKGSIRFDDRDITGLPSRTITRLGISRSFQVAQIFPSLTVYENLCLAAAVGRGKNGILALALRALRTPEIIADVDAVIELFQISQYSDTPAAMLPQGARKLLDIAMAIGGSPRLLLLDEPTSGISVEEKFAIMDVVMSALRSRKITILFVEHDMDIVRRYTERILAFYEGRIIADDTPDTVLDDDDVRKYVTGTTHPRVTGGAASDAAH